MPNTKNERDAGLLPWDKGHPLDGEIVLAVRTLESGKEEFFADDPVEFLRWLADNYPIVLNSMRLELATYQYDGSGPTAN